jgi:hypothetical protein
MSENLMIDVLRECANDGKPIGTDAMCIRIPRSEAKPTIRFEPAKMPARIFTRERDGKSQAMSVAYTPTIITPRAIQLPSLTTGVPFENLNGFEVDWKLPPLGPLAFDGTLLWINDRQPRRPNPSDGNSISPQCLRAVWPTALRYSLKPTRTVGQPTSDENERCGLASDLGTTSQ